MNQLDTKNAATSLNLIGKVLFWLAGILLFVAMLMIMSDDKSLWILMIPVGLLVWLIGCFFRGMAAIVFNQIENNKLLALIADKK